MVPKIEKITPLIFVDRYFLSLALEQWEHRIGKYCTLYLPNLFLILENY